MIIINEHEYVKQILENKIIPKNVSNKRVLLYIAKYYYSPEYSINEMKQLVFDKMTEFKLDTKQYQEYKYDTYVKNICEKLKNNELSCGFRKIESVNIYQSELDIINQCETDKEKKLLFTLYVLAKVNGNNSGWVNNEIKDIFQLANITATIKERAAMIYKLYKAGLVNQSQKIDNLSLKVELGQDNEDVVLVIDSFENIGNQYIANFKDGWKMCGCCGKLFKIKSNEGRPSKYCHQCYKDKHMEQDRLYQKNKRNSKTSTKTNC